MQRGDLSGRSDTVVAMARTDVPRLENRKVYSGVTPTRNNESYHAALKRDSAEPLNRPSAMTLFDEGNPISKGDYVVPRVLTELGGVPHPFPYQGSKRGLASAIIPMIPKNTNRIIEPFAGSAAISIAARYSGRVQETIINDINQPLMNLWYAIINSPVELSNAYACIWEKGKADPRNWFMKIRSDFNKNQKPEMLLYLLNRIVKGAIRYSSSGAFNQSADNRRIGARPQIVRDRLVRTANTMCNTVVLAGSFEPLLLSAKPNDVVYLDPPYQGTSGLTPDHRYASGLSRKLFESALSEAVRSDISFIVSYDQIRDDNKYGYPLSSDLGLTHLHISSGYSAQATLLGKLERSIESLYLSPALVSRLDATTRKSTFEFAA